MNVCTQYQINKMFGYCRYWIGLNRLESNASEPCICDRSGLTESCINCRNTFSWSDRITDFVPDFWGHPGDPEEDEHCVRIRTIYEGRYAWGAAVCDETQPYICEAGKQ